MIDWMADIPLLIVMARIEREKVIVAHMVRLYCRRKEGNKSLCPECKALIEYAHERLSHCPSGDAKGPCRSCAHHCYRPDMREKIRTVMRYSGPRTIFFAPWETLKHMFLYGSK